MTKEIKYEVIKKIGVLDSDSTMQKELRIIKWGDNDEKYDLRGWRTDKNGNEVCGKGITMDTEELASLYEILKGVFE